MADPSDSRGSRGSQDVPARSGDNRALLEKIEAVSGALMARKSLLDRPPSPAKINLSDLARSIGDVLRSNAVASHASKFEGHSISLDSTRVRLPEGGPAGSNDVEAPQEEEAGSGKNLIERSSRSVQANGDPTPAGRAIPSASLPVRSAEVTADLSPAAKKGPSSPSSAARIDRSIEGIHGVSNRPEESLVPVARSSTSPTVRVSSGGSLDPGGVGDHGARPDAGSAVRNAGQPDPIQVVGVGRHSDHDGVDAPVKGTAVPAFGLPGFGESVKTPPESRAVAAVQDAFARVAHSGSMADHQSGSSVHAEPSMSFVRNPLSSELKDFSLSGPALPGQGGSASDQGGIGKGPGEPASGGATSPQGEASGDLSRTNELLQQLIDAVRKQRGSSLPPGGPSVYPDR